MVSETEVARNKETVMENQSARIPIRTDLHSPIKRRYQLSEPRKLTYEKQNSTVKQSNQIPFARCLRKVRKFQIANHLSPLYKNAVRQTPGTA